ncbi:MAG: SRPBCC family protein [Candidatus Nanopelagicales bacterium]|jgi:hypothetical protein|nr:SRPBCC family protein [Candidatus Nanopelagicales bacterium]
MRIPPCFDTPVEESTRIAASPEAVYDLIADVAAIGRLSPEATGAFGAGQRLRAGDTFVGTNRSGPFRWATWCRVTEAERGRVFAFDVWLGAPVSSWRYTIEPLRGGCRVTEEWVDRRSGPRGALVRIVGEALIPEPRDEHNRATMRATLAQLKSLAEGAGEASP